MSLYQVYSTIVCGCTLASMKMNIDAFASVRDTCDSNHQHAPQTESAPSAPQTGTTQLGSVTITPTTPCASASAVTTNASRKMGRPS